MEIDVLTGDFKVLKTDIVMDVGRSINPAIDVEQIEGAFIQGMGLFTMGEMVYLNEGRSIQKGVYLLPYTCMVQFVLFLYVQVLCLHVDLVTTRFLVSVTYLPT